MADLIDRQMVMNAFAERVKRSNNSDFAPTPTWNNAVEIVENLPSADAQPIRHGKWIEVDDDLIRGRCSNCGWEAHLYEDDVVGMPYCPNCGARMDGEQDG